MAKVSICKGLVKICLATWMSAIQYFPVLPRNVENDELGSVAAPDHHSSSTAAYQGNPAPQQ